MTHGKFFRTLPALAILAFWFLSIGLPAGNPRAAHAQEETPAALQLEQPAGDGNPEGVDPRWWAEARTALAGAEYDVTSQEELLLPGVPAAVAGPGMTPAWAAESNQVGAYFSFSVASAGDVNGDGYADVIVGAHGYDNGQTNEGAAFVYYGAAGGLSASPGWTAESDQAFAYFGYSVASAGDVNGDGYDDVVIGAYEYDNGQSGEGRAYVYYGSATGLGAMAGWTAESDQAGAYFGASVATAGDVNGDGYEDLIVGAPHYQSPLAVEGRAYVFYGAAGGLSANPGWTAETNQAAARFGCSVASAGDVNGDGYDEVIVGSPYYDNGQVDEGAAVVYYGGAGGLSASPGWRAEIDQAAAHFGASVASAGDVNGDGYDEVIVGADWYDNGENAEGAVAVFYGAAAGLPANPGWMAERNQADAHFGASVASAGDVNGDGYDDVMAGAPYYDNGVEGGGAAVVYYGTAGGLRANHGWTAESNQAETWFGYSVGSAGDVNGDGYADVIAGAPFYDNGEDAEGAAAVYNGVGGGLRRTWVPIVWR